jgi:hypothetical protein
MSSLSPLSQASTAIIASSSSSINKMPCMNNPYLMQKTLFVEQLSSLHHDPSSLISAKGGVSVIIIHIELETLQRGVATGKKYKILQEPPVGAMFLLS